jgi:hypothetical protein
LDSFSVIDKALLEELAALLVAGDRKCIHEVLAFLF